MKIKMVDGIKKLESVIEEHMKPGNFDNDPMDHGILNGLICAHQIITVSDKYKYLLSVPTYGRNKKFRTLKGSAANHLSQKYGME